MCEAFERAEPFMSWGAVLGALVGGFLAYQHSYAPDTLNIVWFLWTLLGASVGAAIGAGLTFVDLYALAAFGIIFMALIVLYAMIRFGNWLFERV